MGTESFFVLKIIPLYYWFGIGLIVFSLFFMIRNLDDRRFQLIFIFSSILLITSFRMVFPVIFTHIIDFEPDIIHYSKIINSWVNTGIAFGADGNYEHDYPLSFLVAYTFIKFGVPSETFLRFSPFLIYGIMIILLYLIVKQIIPKNRDSRIPFISVFLFSFSSLGYWITVHYCPDLFGSMFVLICLYFGIQFTKNDNWKITSLLPVFICIFLLILTHHLGTLYLIITFLGFSLSCWFFKPVQFKNGTLKFFILAILTYTTWFAYGSLVYPKFFNVYVYFSGFSNPIQQAVSADIISNLSFAIYPLFILVLFMIEFLKILNIKKFSSLFSFSIIKIFKSKLNQIQINERNNTLLVFTAGFSFIIIAFFAGFGVPVLFGGRLLELVCISLYPLASQSILKFADTNSPKKKGVLIMLILFVVFTGVYRYYSQIQRRVIID